jgi:outer membrane protein OmpA-like peptidoglycan-associated protein
MAESFLSFDNSESFRKKLLVRNLTPYNVPGSYTSPGNPINYETNLTVSNVVDSPNNYVSTNIFATELYPLNEYGPEGGFGRPIRINSVASTNNPEGTNQGPYQPIDTALDIINEFFIDSAYVTNKWGPSGGYKDLIVITDVQNGGKLYQPYWDPGYFNYSSYPVFNIVFQDDPVGSNGPLSEDTFLAKIGASQLKFAFNERIAQEINQATVGAINLDTITDPFSASLLATGQQPFFIRDWKITVPENPVLASVSLANRLTGTYFPVSFIPGDYFDETDPYTNPQQTNNALNTINNLTGGLLSPILNKSRNPSEIFVANTGNGTRSTLFAALNYNQYRPSYNIGFVQGLSAITGGLVGQDTPATGTYYVGNSNSEPSLITSPPNQVPVNEFGVQQAAIVYGPQELGILYEGNEGQLNFGLKGKSYSDGGGIAGQLVWTSPKYKPNAGFRATKGGGAGSLDDDFNQISADYLSYQSTDIEFKPGSILYETQRLIESADQLQGQARLKHVGTAINQVSKVFNDGYKELTKGSQVLSYVDQADGTQAGLEYCRVFQKDTPYYTYADLQKTDGITTSGRRFDYSVFDNTYNLNIAPLRNPGSTNIVDGKVKKYMFSIENLAWRTSDRPGYTYDDLPVCEKGPNGGRIMWFPPYNLKFSDDSKPDFNTTNFIGRPEPIYTYKNTSRSGQLSWTIIVDNPSMLNTIIEKQMKGINKDRVQSVVDSFFAGCMKYDMYELGIKFNTIPSKDLFTYQQLLNNPRLTSEEQVEIMQSIGVNEETTVVGNSSNPDNTSNTTSTGTQTAQNPEYVETTIGDYVGYGFYFENDVPGGYIKEPGEDKTKGIAANNFQYYLNRYVALKNTTYAGSKPPSQVKSGNDTFSKDGIPNFFDSVISGNFDVIQNDFMKKVDDILVKQKGKVEIELVGSASAPQTESYNLLLSERRNDSVKKWMLAYKLSDNKTIQEYQNEQKFKLIFDPQGETISIAKTKEIAASTSDPNDVSVTNAQGGNVLNAGINCSQDVVAINSQGQVIPDQQKPNEAEWYSIPAMACRRVTIKKVKVEIPKEPTQQTDTTGTKIDDKENVANVLTEPTQSIKPQPKLTIQQKIKEGISKQILRNLFTECDYFQVIKESDPMIYETIKDKIKFFSPAFHSMTPEGLNARLTFLQQCMRPGQTIPIIGPDGRPKYNDALNTSFGAPPILVLRVGDFYNTKIVPTSLGISYEPLTLDLNPEGIGIQPMIANITMAFNIIGGMGLKEPVQELQNALSFNFYANTEIYDERATATEDTSSMDKYVVEKINGALPTATLDQAAQVNNVQPKKGGSTIGVVASDTDMDYTTLLGSLQEGMQGYFKTYYDSISKINTDYNFGVLQLSIKNNLYTDGVLSEYTADKAETKLFGKSNTYQEYTENLIKDVKKDIEQNKDPITDSISGNIITNKQRRELEDRLQTFATERQSAILNVISNNVANITKVETELNFIFRQLDVVSSKLDGELGSNNEPITYDLSGDTFFGSSTSDGSLSKLYTKNVPEAITKFDTLLIESNLISKDGFFKTNRSTIENGTGCRYVINGSSFFGAGNGNCPYNRFYIAMSPLFTKPDLLTQLKNTLTGGDEVKKSPNLVQQINKVCDDLAVNYTDFQKIWTDIFDNVAKSPEYDEVSKFSLPDNQVKTCKYVKPATGDINLKNKRIKDLYSNSNLNNDKKTFNGKVTFN